MLKADDVLKSLDIRAYFAQRIHEARNGKTEITISSPFREDKHPSFSISLSTGLCHDFALGEGGSVFAFEMRKSNCRSCGRASSKPSRSTTSTISSSWTK